MIVPKEGELTTTITQKVISKYRLVYIMPSFDDTKFKNINSNKIGQRSISKFAECTKIVRIFKTQFLLNPPYILELIRIDIPR